MKRMLNVILSWAVVFLCMGSIYAFSAQSGQRSNEISKQISEKVVEYTSLPKQVKGKQSPVQVDYNYIFRKVGHFTGYFILSLLTYRAMRIAGCKRGISSLIAIGFSMAFAATDEYHQYFVKGRTSRVYDVLIDWAGAWSALGVGYLLRKAGIQKLPRTK